MKMLSPEEIVYGSHINEISINNIEEREISFPFQDSVTILFFFNIDYTAHHRILKELNFLSINLNYAKRKVRFIGISNGGKSNFIKIKSKYNITFDLINDTEEKVFSVFNYNCGSCLFVILIDKDSKVRYLSFNIDPLFLRELVHRYSVENIEE